MNELYLATFDGVLHFTPLCQVSRISKALLCALKEENFSNFFERAVYGDPNDIHATVYGFKESCDYDSCGVIIIRDASSLLYAVVMTKELDLTEAMSHFSDMTSSIRYAKDIFEDKTEIDND